jgi:formylmethanofuran dehydrogenase subunit E
MASLAHNAPPELIPYLQELARLHPRLCPRQVLGVRMGLLAGEALDLKLPCADKRLLMIVETDGCFADGVSVVTGCWLGRRTLRLADYGRVAATAVDAATGRAVRIRPHPGARESALCWAPQTQNRWHAQLLGYQVMPASELLQTEPVTLATPVGRILGIPGVRVTCTACGEEVLNSRQTPSPEGPVCQACAAGRYYIQLNRGPKGGAAEITLPHIGQERVAGVQPD